MGGADVVIGNLTSAQDGLILGAFGGSIDLVVNLNTAATRLKFSGGTVGGYGTYFNGPWFADLIVKADILSLMRRMLDLLNPPTWSITAWPRR